MKVLMLDPGAGTSTIDIHNGYAAALRRAGHEVRIYSVNQRIERAGSWLSFNYRKAKREDPSVEKPNTADILYWAGVFSIEMALRLMPDWIVVVSGMFLLKDTMTLLRKATWPHSKMALLLSESPYDDDGQEPCTPLFDLVFTNERRSVARLRTSNPNTYYLPHAYDPDIHRPDLPVDDDVAAHDVVFVGSGFRERIDLLAAVDWSGIDLGLYGNWDMLGSRSKLRQHVRGGQIDNTRAAMLYRRAKIGLNLHRTRMSNGQPIPPGMAESLNPRAYELAACGVFQVCDARRELREVLPSVWEFSDAKGLELLIRRTLNGSNSGGLRQAARATREVAPHSYDARAATLLEVLSERARAA